MLPAIWISPSPVKLTHKINQGGGEERERDKENYVK